MFKILTKQQINLTSSLLDEILLPYGITKCSYSIPESGVSNTNVIVTTEKGKFFLRIIRQGKKEKSELELESNFMNFLLSQGLPVPKIIKNKNDEDVSIIRSDGLDWLYQLFDFMQGEHPEFNLFSKDLPFLQNLAKKHATLLLASVDFSHTNKGQQITNTSETSSARIIENILADINLSNIKNKSLIELIESRNKLFKTLDSSKLQYAWLHDDINVSNILVNGNTVSSILDFDEFYYGPVASCVANTAFEFIRFRNSPEILHTYLYYFEQTMSLSTEDKQIIKDFLSLRNLMFIVYLLKFHGEDFKFIDVHFNLANKINLL